LYAEDGQMRFRQKRRGGDPEPDATCDTNQGDRERAPGEVDVQGLVDRFMIDPEAAVATRRWTPSRRGNSPHHLPDPAA
jgi:hypothetical protein